ncbi:putative enhancer of rudimentary [Hyaloraphidium curvatum]|nr:putative enhancer of rudimentary [Hyaloraphidium curvatum]
MAVHTILLLQKTPNKLTRTYDDFESISLCCEAVIKLFETHLKSKYPNQLNISYDINDLNKFLDTSYQDMAALVFDPATAKYTPHDRDWIKERVYAHLKRAATRR